MYAFAIGQSSFLILGGDDGSLVDFKPAKLHPGFTKSILAYDTNNGTWKSIGEMPAAHVTTTMTLWNDRFVMPTGEVRPGVRSPAVWAFDKARNR